MRGLRGKLICVWSPVLHGEGCSTLACAIGIELHQLTGKRALIVNLSDSIGNMEKFVEKDIEIKYSMDNLKIFSTGIKAEHILTYATQVNTGLYMIAGSRLEIKGEHIEFDSLFIDKCLDAFDLVIADIRTGVREENNLYLKMADSIIAVVTPNEIVLDKLFESSSQKLALQYFIDERTVNIINKLYNSWDTGSVVRRFKNKYSLNKAFGMNFDGEVLDSCCMDNNFYSFLMKRFRDKKSEYMRQLKNICSFIASELSIQEVSDESIAQGTLLKILRKSSLY